MIKLLFLLVGMLALSVAGAESANMSSSEKLDCAATERMKERSLGARTDAARESQLRGLGRLAPFEERKHGRKCGLRASRTAAAAVRRA